MFMKQKEKKDVSIKNYIIIFIISLGVILFMIYIFQLIKLYQSNKDIKESPLSKIVYEIQYDELDDVFAESSDDYFIYISYVDDLKVLKLEKEIKKLIVDNNLQNNIYYLNATDLKNKKDFIKKLNDKLSLKEQKIKKLPAIIYYKDKNVNKVMDSYKNIFNIDELKKIIEKNEID